MFDFKQTIYSKYLIWSIVTSAWFLLDKIFFSQRSGLWAMLDFLLEFLIVIFSIVIIIKLYKKIKGSLLYLPLLLIIYHIGFHLFAGFARDIILSNKDIYLSTLLYTEFLFDLIVFLWSISLFRRFYSK